MNLAKRVSALTPSATLAITAKAKDLKAAGHDVIGLGAGEPDFNTPEHIIEAAVRSMNEGHTKYTPSGGLAALKDSIRENSSAIRESSTANLKLSCAQVQSMLFTPYFKCSSTKGTK